ncbi:MAG: C2H2-type zinc finger protein [Candidatus Thorarchaeota archaeon]
MNQKQHFECKLCGKTFNSQEEMKNHAAEIHHKHK